MSTLHFFHQFWTSEVLERQQQHVKLIQCAVFHINVAKYTVYCKKEHFISASFWNICFLLQSSKGSDSKESEAGTGRTGAEGGHGESSEETGCFEGSPRQTVQTAGDSGSQQEQKSWPRESGKKKVSMQHKKFTINKQRLLLLKPSYTVIFKYIFVFIFKTCLPVQPNAFDSLSSLLEVCLHNFPFKGI